MKKDFVIPTVKIVALNDCVILASSRIKITPIPDITPDKNQY